MGMKRGSFESVGLGALAQGANPTYHQHNSVAAGLGALAQGIKSYAEGWGAISDGLKAWGKVFHKWGEYAVEADKQQKESQRMARRAMAHFKERVKVDGLNENDPRYWQELDQVKRYKDMAAHQGLFGIYSAPQPTRAYTPEQRKKRATIMGVKEDSDKRVSYGYGGIESWDGELGHK